MDTDKSSNEAETTGMSFEELDRLAEDKKLTQEDLNAEINKYAEAYRQEYELRTAEAPDDVVEYTNDYFKKNVHAAAAQIVWLATNADKENTRLAAAKYVVDKATQDAIRDSDPFDKLFKDLQKVESPSLNSDD